MSEKVDARTEIATGLRMRLGLYGRPEWKAEDEPRRQAEKVELLANVMRVEALAPGTWMPQDEPLRMEVYAAVAEFLSQLASMIEEADPEKYAYEAGYVDEVRL